VLAAITVVQLPNRRSAPVTLVEPIE
jgi:hypothetical protein